MYVHGHNRRGKTGYKMPSRSVEHYKKISEYMKGKKNGLGVKRSEEFREQRRQKMMGERNPMFGKKHTEEANKRRSVSNKKRFENNPFLREKVSLANKKRYTSIEERRKTGNASKKLWENPEYRDKVVKNTLKSCLIKPNKAELQLQSILQDLYPNEFKYVGDGEVIIAGKCPDFININGKKQIIELFGDYWHKV